MRPLERHRRTIESGKVSRSTIIGIRKLINAAECRNRGYSVGMTAPAATVTETLALRRLIAEKNPIVTGELQESGLKILRSKRWAKRFTEREHRIIETLDHFELAAFDLIENTSAPVYRAVASDGQSFLFRNAPWQAVAYGNGETESGPTVIRDRD